MTRLLGANCFAIRLESARAARKSPHRRTFAGARKRCASICENSFFRLARSKIVLCGARCGSAVTNGMVVAAGNNKHDHRRHAGVALVFVLSLPLTMTPLPSSNVQWLLTESPKTIHSQRRARSRTRSLLNNAKLPRGCRQLDIRKHALQLTGCQIIMNVPNRLQGQAGALQCPAVRQRAGSRWLHARSVASMLFREFASVGGSRCRTLVPEIDVQNIRKFLCRYQIRNANKKPATPLPIFAREQALGSISSTTQEHSCRG